MNYQKALDRIRVLKTQMYADFVYRVATKGSMILLESEIDDNLDIFQQLINEKLEQESRKDKLIVGSQWECAVDCYAIDNEHESTFFLPKETVVVTETWESNIELDHSKYIFTQQFLLCFKPIKKGDKDEI